MPGEENESRKLAPDSWKILGVIGTGVVVIIGVTQYQIDRGAELVLERMRAQMVSTKEMSEAFRPRDEKIKSLWDTVADLREERAKVGESLININTTLSRIVDVSIETQARAAQTEGQLNQLLKQADTNAKIAAQIVERQQSSYQVMSDRLARLEGTRTAPDTIR